MKIQGNIDYKLFFVVLILIVFGMIMISSVSIYPSFNITSKLVASGAVEETFNYFYVRKNIFHVLLSLFVLAVISKVPYGYFEKFAKQIFAIVLVLLFVVLFSEGWNGAR